MTPRAWLLTDDAAGNIRQAEALAVAMGLDARAFRIALPPPWSWFAPHLRAGAWARLPAALTQAAADAPPEIAIGCGRAAALATCVLRTRIRCFAVQILDPRADASAWDVIVTPAHDRLRGDNVVNTIGALNLVTPARLAAAGMAHPDLARYPTPRTALLVGGSTRAQRIDAAYVDGLVERLDAWHASQGGSFLVTASRRTPPDVVVRLRAWIAQRDGMVWAGDADGPNPYPGLLAHASRIVVTPDSVNLLSEACATGKPVLTYAPQHIRGKLATFHRELTASGRVRPLDFTPATWAPLPLRETEAVAEEVWRRYRAWKERPRLL